MAGFQSNGTLQPVGKGTERTGGASCFACYMLSQHLIRQFATDLSLGPLLTGCTPSASCTGTSLTDDVVRFGCFLRSRAVADTCTEHAIAGSTCPALQRSRAGSNSIQAVAGRVPHWWDTAWKRFSDGITASGVCRRSARAQRSKVKESWHQQRWYLPKRKRSR